MEDPRPEKVAVVDEVRARLGTSDATVLTEYRGLNVSATAELRRALRAAGGDFKIYKNTLVRFAARDLGLEIDHLLTGPTAIAFVEDGDPVTVAKALRDFARTNPDLVIKGGLLGDQPLDEAAMRALADVEPREVLLARLAGLMAAPMQQFAGLLSALPRDLAYGLQALIDQGGAPGAPAGETPTVADAPSADEPTTTEDTPSAANETPAADTTAPADDTPSTEATAPVEETPAEAAAPAADTDTDTETAAESADT
jgi:large subunit ribosomal protein L10